jgi:hypothetical protein
MGEAGIEDMEALAWALPRMASLMTLKLSNIAGLRLAAALPRTAALTTLDLSGAASACLELSSVSGCCQAQGIRFCW